MVENSRGDLNAKVKCNQHHLAGVQCTRYYAVNDTAVLVTFFIIRLTCVTQKCVLFTCSTEGFGCFVNSDSGYFNCTGPEDLDVYHCNTTHCSTLQHNTLSFDPLVASAGP